MEAVADEDLWDARSVLVHLLEGIQTILEMHCIFDLSNVVKLFFPFSMDDPVPIPLVILGASECIPSRMQMRDFISTFMKI